MKKIIVFLTIFTIVCSTAFAAVEFSPNTDGNIYGALKAPYKNLDVRSLGMGGVGVAATSNAQSFWLNPAGLGDKKVQVSLPSVGVTLYHPATLYKMYDSGLINDIMDGNVKVEELYKDENINKIFSYGYGKIAAVTAGLSFTAGGFGFGVAVQDSILTYLNGQISTTNIINQINAEARIGYGFKLSFSEKMSLDIGLSVGFNYLAYNRAINISTVMDLLALQTKIQIQWTRSHSWQAGQFQSILVCVSICQWVSRLQQLSTISMVDIT